jgi:hypothetical protein
VQATYDFEFIAPVEAQPVAGYSKGSQEIVTGKGGKAVEARQTANYAMSWWKNLLKKSLDHDRLQQCLRPGSAPSIR